MGNKITAWLFRSRSRYSDAAILVIRIVIGITYIVRGYPKIIGGSERWLAIGTRISVIGIEFGYTFFGFLASFSEFFGGMALLIGLFTRLSTVGIGFTMIIAALSHITHGDSITRILHPLELLAVCLFLYFNGAGRFSVDHLLKQKIFTK
ncbi:MAG: DoxX family protein [Candidatus Neomarinimicrobiota bacterium]